MNNKIENVGVGAERGIAEIVAGTIEDVINFNNNLTEKYDMISTNCSVLNSTPKKKKKRKKDEYRLKRIEFGVGIHALHAYC